MKCILTKQKTKQKENNGNTDCCVLVMILVETLSSMFNVQKQPIKKTNSISEVLGARLCLCSTPFGYI